MKILSATRTPAKKMIVTIMVLSAIFIFHFLNNFFWLKLDSAPTGIGTDWYLAGAVKFQIAFRQIFYSDVSLADKLIQAYDAFAAWPSLTSRNTPPLAFLLAFLINPDHFHLFNVRFYFNTFFLILLIVSTYFLAKKLFSRKAGIFSAFLVSFYPLVIAYARQYGPDFPLTAVTVLCLALLVRSNHYSSGFYSILLGLCLGMGALLKLQIAFFLIGPMLYSFFIALRECKHKAKKPLVHFGIVLLLSFSLASCYWAKIMGGMVFDFLQHMLSLYPGYDGPKLEGAIAPFSFEGFTYYAKQLINIVSLPLFIAFLLSLAKLFKAKERAKAFLVWCFFPPFLIFTLISAKGNKFILPLIPVLAIITSWGIMTIRGAVLRRTALLGVVFYLIVLVSYASWFRGYHEFENILTLSPEDGVMLRKPTKETLFKILREQGVLGRIRNKIDQGDIVNLNFTDNAQESAFLVYGFFQDDVFLNKLVIQLEMDGRDFKAPDFIMLAASKFNLNPELIKEYRVISYIWNDYDAVYVLEREMR